MDFVFVVLVLAAWGMASLAFLVDSDWEAKSIRLAVLKGFYVLAAMMFIVYADRLLGLS